MNKEPDSSGSLSILGHIGMKNSLFNSEFTNELQRSMEKNLVVKQAGDNNQGLSKVAKATEYLSAAADIFEQAGMVEPAEEITKVLEELAKEIK